jgi:hypothetical protein
MLPGASGVPDASGTPGSNDNPLPANAGPLPASDNPLPANDNPLPASDDPPPANPDPLPFNVSLGAALTDYPLAHAACLILELAGREIEFGRASLLLRSPFIAAGESETAARAGLDLELRRRRRRVRAGALATPAQTGRFPQVRSFRRARAIGMGEGHH